MPAARPGPAHGTPYPGGPLAGVPSPTPVPRRAGKGNGDLYPPLSTKQGDARPARAGRMPPVPTDQLPRRPRSLLIAVTAAVAAFAIAAIFWAVNKEPEVIVQRVEVPGPPTPPPVPPLPRPPAPSSSTPPSTSRPCRGR